MTDDQQIFPLWIRNFLSGYWPVALLLSCHLLLGIGAVSRKSATCDEGLHLVGGFSYWATGDYRINPESGNWPQRWAALPMKLEGHSFLSLDNSAWRDRDEWNFASQLLYDSGNDPDAMLLQGRAMIGLLSTALGAIVYFWSRQLFGAIGGLISLTLYAFSPTFLSNGFLVTADLASALFFSAAMWAMWTLFHRISAFTLAISTITFAGLLLSKFSGVLIVPMGLLLILIRLARSQPLLVVFQRTFEIRGRCKQLAVLTVMLITEVLGVLFLIWVSYGFRYATMETGDSNNQPLVTSWEKLSTHLRLVGPVVQFAGEHRLLPEPFLYGFAYTLASTESRQSFFNGKFGLHGWLVFFPYCLAVKTPLEVFVILLLAAAGAWYFHDKAIQFAAAQSMERYPIGGLYSISPLLVLLSVYWIASLSSHLNIGQRHLLPTYPPMFILAGAAAVWFAGSSVPLAKQGDKEISNSRNHANRTIWAARLLLVGSLTLAIVEGLWIWPDYLAYFNILAGGPSHGYRHLVDSSLDWGQDLKELKDWFQIRSKQPQQRIYLAYFGATSPQYYRINATTLPGFGYIDHRAPAIPDALTGGTYCISATLLEGVGLRFPGKWNVEYEDLYQQLRRDAVYYQRAFGPVAISQISSGADSEYLDHRFRLYEQLRLARLCSFLRQREPDANLGHSILIYELSDADIQKAIEDNPIELQSESEADVKEFLRAE